MVADGAGGLVETKVKFPVWFDAVAVDGTPMLDAARLACGVLRPWVDTHKQSYPPIVINITDGMPNEDPTPAAIELIALGTDDGNVLLYNLHLSDLAASPLLFPAASAGLPDEFAQMLFQMSSPVPPRIQEELKVEGYSIEPGARGFVFNADAVALIKFLDIGTRVVLESGSRGTWTQVRLSVGVLNLPKAGSAAAEYEDSSDFSRKSVSLRYLMARVTTSSRDSGHVFSRKPLCNDRRKNGRVPKCLTGWTRSLPNGRNPYHGKTLRSSRRRRLHRVLRRP